MCGHDDHRVIVARRLSGERVPDCLLVFETEDQFKKFMLDLTIKESRYIEPLAAEGYNYADSEEDDTPPPT